MVSPPRSEVGPVSSPPTQPCVRPWRVCVITGSRSEYGLMRWVLEGLRDDPAFRVQLIATGSHFSTEHGETWREIVADGFTLDAAIPLSLGAATPATLAAAVGDLAGRLAVELERLQPDLVMVMGDRYELLGVITACILVTVPIAHLSGGELTEGVIDEQVRHAVTKAAHLHFVAHDLFGARVAQMGEESWRICVCGEPGLDGIHRLTLPTPHAFAADIGFAPGSPLALVTFHPVTLEREALGDQVSALVAALEEGARRYGLQYLLTYPNSDAGADRIIAAFQLFAAGRPDRRFTPSLGRRRYLAALRDCRMMIGNSSSGLYEAPCFNLPVINIGSRQGGRLRGTNVLDVAPDTAAIVRGMEQALGWDRTVSCTNPYGDGHAIPRMLAFLKAVLVERNRDDLLRKRFQDMDRLQVPRGVVPGPHDLMVPNAPAPNAPNAPNAKE